MAARQARRGVASRLPAPLLLLLAAALAAVTLLALAGVADATTAARGSSSGDSAGGGFEEAEEGDGQVLEGERWDGTLPSEDDDEQAASSSGSSSSSGGGGRYGSGGRQSRAPKDKWFQLPFKTCPEPYNAYSYVTRIEVCRDASGYISGLKYYSEHPTRHHDPVTVCDVSTTCETVDVPGDAAVGRGAKFFVTATNVRAGKVRDAAGNWRIAALLLSFANGETRHIGPSFESLKAKAAASNAAVKLEQWFQEPTSGFVCGLNGFFSTFAWCHKDKGYLQYLWPCGKCVTKAKIRKRNLPEVYTKDGYYFQ